jgi:hypothetical protein
MQVDMLDSHCSVSGVASKVVGLGVANDRGLVKGIRFEGRNRLPQDASAVVVYRLSSKANSQTKMG